MENENRETKTIETPIQKHKVELKTYLTGFEKRSITNVFLSDAKFKVENGQTKTNDLNGSIIEKAQDKTIETVVVSVDGEKEEILKNVGDMHSKDFDFLINEINKITDDKDIDAKKNLK